MYSQKTQERFTKEVFDLLDETFESHQGIYLDKGTSLFETLENLSAMDASHSVAGGCATIAAQVVHITFYLEVLENYILMKDAGNVDWQEIWKRVNVVNPEEWVAIKLKLKQTYIRLKTEIWEIENDSESAIVGALEIIVHTAYHLGEIRQALCALNNRK